MNRIQSFDLAKGLCISVVVLFHVRGIAAHELPFESVLFSSFMLPPFFFLAGVFFRDHIAFKVFLVKKINTLLIPFAFFYLTTSVLIPNILHYAFGIHFETVVGWPSLWAFVWPGEYPNIPIWFLWCLFVMEILLFMIAAFTRRFVRKYADCLMILICFTLAIVGWFLESYFSTDIACLFNALKNLPFLCLGYIANNFTMHLQKTVKGIRALCILVVALGVASLPLLLQSHHPVTAHFLFYYLYGIAGSFFIIMLSAFFNYLPLFNYLGRYSIIVLLTHGVFVRIGYPLFISLTPCLGEYGSVFLFWSVIVLSYLCVIPLLRRVMPHVTAQKPVL